MACASHGGKIGDRAVCVHGYHVYKDIWEAVTREELPCERGTQTTDML